jgi:hypothetical protein
MPICSSDAVLNKNLMGVPTAGILIAIDLPGMGCHRRPRQAYIRGNRRQAGNSGAYDAPETIADHPRDLPRHDYAGERNMDSYLSTTACNLLSTSE